MSKAKVQQKQRLECWQARGSSTAQTHASLLLRDGRSDADVVLREKRSSGSMSQKKNDLFLIMATIIIMSPTSSGPLITDTATVTLSTHFGHARLHSAPKPRLAATFRFLGAALGSMLTLKIPRSLHLSSSLSLLPSRSLSLSL